ncbi:hypothetical protein GTA62_05130 [Roseobacter sp. HKCCD9010]|uniref:dienelactone hydrolase family protein n=1 Tax=unclassified Roseobacter TaxID=196798 RepID=UPI001491B3B4|nr:MULTISPECIES: hypothetical protein [unclassified Roseobacter]MBF9048744.1 hypothetical protein [Rhodobacterales bacterium HKCCD4356]NNV10743.1 hypothetical protein [Roseobacter sp. HKCCD7357]NNV14928.1 hypothetical protein [Roseobacter sp. HKCCD8768]NNV24387.1 hypothetical protein [Roseobacter sp. HKCCD8192]NNV28644.1 hypothetical protein [Roseobacter sp. HKCCD9061]
MRITYFAVLALLGAAFLAAIAVLVTPNLIQDDRSYMTLSAPDAANGTFVETDRPDLRPSIPDHFDYNPETRNTVRHRLLNGAVPRSFVVYAPVIDQGPRPTVLLFHGAGRDAASMIDMWDDVADAEGLMLIAIQAPFSGWPVEAPNGAFIHNVLTQAETTYPIDRERLFLFGHSNGAKMAQVVANRVQGPWRGVASHGGYPDPAWMHRIEEAPPIRSYLGTSDHIFVPAQARLSGSVVATAGHDFELIFIPSHTHWFYEGGPAFAADAWSWFESL